MQPAPEASIAAEDLHLVLEAEPESVRLGLAQMLGLPPLVRLPPEAKGTAELVLAEVLNNVAEHAYADRPGTVEVTLTPVTSGIRCLIVDWGVAMPGERLPDGRLPGGADTALEDLPEGGFGWHLIRVLTQDLAYQRSGDQNRLSFLLPLDG